MHLEGYNLDVRILGSLLLHESNSVGLIVLDTDIALGHVHGLHEERYTYENLLGLLKHELMVSGEVGLTLYGIDDDTLGLATGRRSELHMCGEACATHTYNTCILDLGYDLGGLEGTLCHQLFTAVDALFPLVANDVDEDSGLAISAGVDDRVYLGHLTRYRREDSCRHETSSIGNLGAHLHHVAFGHTCYGRSTYVL